MAGNQNNLESSPCSSAADPWLGLIVGDRYSIEARLGKGGMGVVYRARHLELGKALALKRLDPQLASDPLSYERFRREAIALSRVQSPHVVHVFDWGKAPDGSPYLVMELLEGSDLRGLMRSEGRLLVPHAIDLIGQVLRALICTHQAGIIHRDLKPENVFLCHYESGELWVKLLDFGISKRIAEHKEADLVTRRGTIVGTAYYMSPEQARGESAVDARSDLYSVGAILYEILTGHVPHRGRTFESTLIDICTRDADDVRLLAPLVPDHVARILAKALKRTPDERFQTAKEFLDAIAGTDRLSQIDSTESTISTPTHPSTLATTAGEAEFAATLRNPLRKRTAWLLSLGLLLLGIAMLGLVAARVRSPSRGLGVTQHHTPAQTAAVADTPALPLPTLPAVANAASTIPPQSNQRTSGTTLPNSSSRGNSNRQNPASGPKSAPTALPGVASELKLRRTMP